MQLRAGPEHAASVSASSPMSFAHVDLEGPAFSMSSILSGPYTLSVPSPLSWGSLSSERRNSMETSHLGLSGPRSHSLLNA